MIARCNVIYSMAPIALTIVAVVGVATAIYAASIALTQNDIKRVLAYSTISQLGYMFLGVGVGAYSAGMFHLMTHAFFKGLLFLGAGSVMHAMSGELDMRKMGGLKGKIPVTFWTFVPATLAIAGIPGFSGFFSKDEILWQAYSSPHGHPLLWAVGVLAAGMTAFYMFRLLFMTFFGKCRAPVEVKKHIHESPKVMTIPLGVLSVLSIIGGYVGISHVFWGGLNKIGEFLAPVVGGHGEATTGHAAFSLQTVAYASEGGGAAAAHTASMEMIFMAISVIIALIGIFIAYVFYIKRPELPGLLAEKRKTLYTVLVNKYFVDEIYGFSFVNSLKALGTGLWRGFDDLVVDGAVNGVGRVTLGFGGILRKIQTGFVQNYAFSMMIGGLIIIGYYVIRAIFY